MHRTSARPRHVARRRLLLAALAVPCLRPEPVAAQNIEEILSYRVDIAVRAGGSMAVTEEITVRALGEEIRRGIYRDFPTSFPRWSGLGRIEAPFEVRSVLRDGSPEPYAVNAIGGPIGRGGVQVRIGRADVLLTPGVYTYAILYETDRWIDYGDETDRLFWNVTGNGWGFTIREASARVRVEGLSEAPTLRGWTGYEGSTEEALVSTWDTGAREASFVTTRPLAPNEGLTIEVAFPTGRLAPPSDEQRSEWFALDWGGWTDAAYVVLFVLALYLLMWRRVGVDPAPGQTRWREEPPDGFSPAALGYLERRGYEMGHLAAALVSMAMKGALRIERNDDSWTLHKLDASVDLSKEERAAFEELLGNRRTITLKQSQHATLQKAIKALKRTLSLQLERDYFVNNRRWFAAGVLVSVLGFAALAWRWRYAVEPTSIFLGIWLTVWTAGTASLGVRIVQAYGVARREGGMQWGGLVFIALFSIPFFVAEIVVAGILMSMMPSHLLFCAVALGVTNVAFYHLLERPTLRGRGVLDQLDGFRQYLAADGQRRLADAGSGAVVFERFLPHAIALGLEQRWAGGFGEALAPRPGVDAHNPYPWYHWHDRDRGHRGRFDASSFASSLGSSLSSTLSASSSPPPSSGGGGGGGGGSSGGGGGGGGGGGW